MFEGKNKLTNLAGNKVLRSRPRAAILMIEFCEILLYSLKNLTC